MSDFLARDVLSGLWNNILKTHWTYLEAEESIVKLEERKKLEDCLKEFLCLVQHDRKFMLPDTAKVLKNSIRDLDNFSAQKGINAFESISEYANNLFTKPWRKEFRILKLYSGFYQHEIKSNLLDAEILFEAMGYRRLTDDTLILDGPICPDQVANVSRDAMIAYVELQIMKHIFSGLHELGIDCSFLDILHYREHYTGSTSQAIIAIASCFEEKRLLRSRQKLLMAGDNYGYIDVQPSPNYYSASSQFCPTANFPCGIYQQAHPMPRQRPITHTNGICCVPEHQKPSMTATNLVYSNMCYSGQPHNQYGHHQQQHAEMPTENGGGLSSLMMPHSRSLEHYSEPSNRYNNPIPHRHSFDHQQQGCTAHHQYHNSQQQQQQQQKLQHPYYHQHLNKVQHNLYESPYDCIDGNSLGGGSSNMSYAAATAVTGVGSNCNLNSSSTTYTNPYNVSGNRIPLPFNISNQLLYETTPAANNYNDNPEPTYAHITEQNMCSLKSTKLPQNSPLYNHPNNNPKNPASLPADLLQKQRSFQSEQLINLDDASILPPPPTLQQHQFASLHQCRPNYDTLNYSADHNQYNMRGSSSRERSSSSTIGQPETNNETYVYAKPIPKENRKQSGAAASRKYEFNAGDTTDISYDSPNDEFVKLSKTENERNHRTQLTKNQDGVGSAELWNNVYQNVEKKVYGKELGERTDFLVQSLDLDSLNINNEIAASQSSSTEKRRSFYSANENKMAQQHEQQQQQQQSQFETKLRSKTFENAKYLTKTKSKSEKVCSSTSTTNNSMHQKQKTLPDNNAKKVKSAPPPKQTNTTSKPNTSANKSQQFKANDNKSGAKTTVNNNNNNELMDISEKASTQHKKSSASTGGTITKRAPSSVASTQIIVTSDNEWSCHFCTFINPNSESVCEMCSHSKGFKMDSSSSSTAGGTTTMTQNTTTCA